MNMSIEISAATTKRLIALGVVAAGLAAGSLAWAGLTPFKTGDVLTHDGLNGNFNSLQAEINMLKEAQAKLSAPLVSAYAAQTDNVTVQSTSVPGWTALPGASVTFDLPAGAAVDLDANVGLDGTSDPGGAVFCRVRFLLDGKSFTAGDEPESEVLLRHVAGTFTEPKTVAITRRATPGAGTHTVSVELDTDPNYAQATDACTARTGRLRVREVR